MQLTESTREYDDDKQELCLTLTASVEEVQAGVEEFFADLASRDVPGFRKGKAPRSVLEQGVGGHDIAMDGVAETIIKSNAFKAIDDADVIFIEEPRFNVSETVEEGKPFSFTVTGPVVPLMKLSDYGPVSIEMPPEKATEKEIDGEIEELRRYYRNSEVIDDPKHKAQLGDSVEMDVAITNHDKPVAGLGKATRMIALGEDIMPMSFDEQIVGHKVGDEFEFDFEAKDENGETNFGDGELHAVVSIKGMRKNVYPDIDDTLAARVGAVDVDDMRKQMQHNINAQKAEELPQVMVNKAVAALAARLEDEVPEYYVNFIRQDVGREYMQSLQESGTSLQQLILDRKVDSDEVKAMISEEASHRAAIDCALNAFFVEKGWEVTEEDIDGMFAGEEIDDTSGSEIKQQWIDANRMSDVRKMCRQSKVTGWLVDNADVTVVE